MRTDFVLEGEGLNELSARLRVPACMLMRANGLYSPAWLLPGREIIVPEGQCRGPIPCPRETFARAIGADEAFLHPGEDTAALCRRLLNTVIVYMAFSLIMAVLWSLLQSPDLAITEAAVGAGISSILFFLTLKKIHGLKGTRDE